MKKKTNPVTKQAKRDEKEIYEGINQRANKCVRCLNFLCLLKNELKQVMTCLQLTDLQLKSFIVPMQTQGHSKN